MFFGGFIAQAHATSDERSDFLYRNKNLKKGLLKRFARIFNPLRLEIPPFYATKGPLANIMETEDGLKRIWSSPSSQSTALNR